VARAASIELAVNTLGSDWWSDPKPPPEEIDRPTPHSVWWTPRHGWKSASCEIEAASGGQRGRRGPPQEVMPTLEEEASLYPEASEVIGELKVEVLEARALRGDWLSKADAYALLVFEGCAAKTNIVQNHDNPGWGAKSSYRAFRFPVTRSYSSLCVTLMESDTHAHAGFIRHLDSDDILGRVTVRLGTLVAKTEYDCTMARCPLAQAHAPPHPPQLRRLTDVYTFVRVRSWCRLVPTALARV